MSQDAAQLWSDEFIYGSVDKVAFDVIHEERIVSVVSTAMAEALIIDMRNANSASFGVQLAEKQAQISALQREVARLSEWQPLSDGKHEVFLKSWYANIDSGGARITFVDKNYPDEWLRVFPNMDIRLCRRVSTDGEAQGDGDLR